MKLSMHAKTDDKDIIKCIYRTQYTDNEYYFLDILKDCILRVIKCDSTHAELLAQNKESKIWNKIKKEMIQDRENGIIPLFSIVSDADKKVKWIGDTSQYGVQRNLFFERPELYKYIDSLSDRQYEVLACAVCKLLGADKIYLTPHGNEGGIDFMARIPFSLKSHFFFGVKGPIRIVGQSKKYATRDRVGNMKEFITTLDFVHNHSFRVGDIIPDWFKMEKGIIIGWHIADVGHQSGALNIAKDYGVLVSDSKQLIDIICKTDILKNEKGLVEIIQQQYMNEDDYI